MLMKNVTTGGPQTLMLSAESGDRKGVITLIYSAPLYFLNGRNPGLSNGCDLFSTAVEKPQAFCREREVYVMCLQ